MGMVFILMIVLSLRCLEANISLMKPLVRGTVLVMMIAQYLMGMEAGFSLANLVVMSLVFVVLLVLYWLCLLVSFSQMTPVIRCMVFAMLIVLSELFQDLSSVALVLLCLWSWMALYPMASRSRTWWILQWIVMAMTLFEYSLIYADAYRVWVPICSSDCMRCCCVGLNLGHVSASGTAEGTEIG